MRVYVLHCRYDGSVVFDDVDVKWRLDGAMPVEEFAKLQFGSHYCQPLACVVTEEALERLLKYLKDFAYHRLASGNGKVKVALVGSSASRWSFFLQYLAKVKMFRWKMYFQCTYLRTGRRVLLSKNHVCCTLSVSVYARFRGSIAYKQIQASCTASLFSRSSLL